METRNRTVPEFKTHLAAGILTGLAVGAFGFISHDLDPVHAGAVMIMGTTGGLLPDMDSDTGKPLALLFQLLSVLFPVLAYPHVKFLYGQDITFLICYYTVSYLFINYGVMPAVKKMTRHRGMMHSIPFAILAGEASFLLLLPSGITTAVYGSLAVFGSVFAHLVLDELGAMTFAFGFIPMVKQSAGSALKLKGHIASTVVMYVFLVCMGIAVADHLLPFLKAFTPWKS